MSYVVAVDAGKWGSVVYIKWASWRALIISRISGEHQREHQTGYIQKCGSLAICPLVTVYIAICCQKRLQKSEQKPYVCIIPELLPLLGPSCVQFYSCYQWSGKTGRRPTNCWIQTVICRFRPRCCSVLVYHVLYFSCWLMEMLYGWILQISWNKAASWWCFVQTRPISWYYDAHIYMYIYIYICILFKIIYRPITKRFHSSKLLILTESTQNRLLLNYPSICKHILKFS